MNSYKLNTKRTILVGFAFFLISAFWQAYDAIVPLALTNHFGLPQWLSGAVMSLDNVLAVFMLPLFGALSDKISTRYGKRTPFVVIGTVAAIITFIILAFIDASQVKAISDAGLLVDYNALKLEEASLKELISAAKELGDTALVAQHEAALETLTVQINNALETVQLKALETAMNGWIIVGFIGVLLMVLISMATFRSPAVALMPDVTIKPLRSKGNAIINLMGTAGGISVLVLGMVFKTSANLFMNYTGYVFAVTAIMALGLVIFIFTVKERKWAAEMEADTERLGLNVVSEDGENSASKRLTKAELTSLLLILASVALWYIGYNSITSKYSVYATNVLGFDYNFTLIVAQAAAVVAYIPVGIIASKFGRRKTILAGIILLAAAFFIGNFITSTVHPAVMYPVFALAGIGWATINVNSFPMVVELARGGDVGKYTGYYYTASMSAQIVAPILSGVLYDLFTMRTVFFAFGTVFVALSFVTMFFVKHGNAQDLGGKTAKEMIADNFGADD